MEIIGAMEVIVVLVCVIVGALISLCSSFFIVNYTRRKEAAARFRAAFAPTLAKYYENPPPHERNTEDWINWLISERVRQAIAVEEYGIHVRRKYRDAYQKAWKEYCNPQVGNKIQDTSAFITAYIHEEKSKENIISRINSLFFFSK